VETSAFLASAEDRVADEAVAALEPRRHRYDQASSAAERGRYVRHLFGLVVQCVHEGHAEPVVASSRQVAADRFEAGLDIAETGRAFNVLEEVLWHELAGALVGEQRIEALGQVRAGRAACAAPGTGEAATTAGTDGLAGAAVRTRVAGAVGVITLEDQPRRCTARYVGEHSTWCSAATWWVADETATFAITAANLGLPYTTTGLLHFVGRLPRNVIKEQLRVLTDYQPIAAQVRTHPGRVTGGLRQRRLRRGPQCLRRQTQANLPGHLIPPNPRCDQFAGPPARRSIS